MFLPSLKAMCVCVCVVFSGLDYVVPVCPLQVSMLFRYSSASNVSSTSVKVSFWRRASCALPNSVHFVFLSLFLICSFIHRFCVCTLSLSYVLSSLLLCVCLCVCVCVCYDI